MLCEKYNLPSERTYLRSFSLYLGYSCLLTFVECKPTLLNLNSKGPYPSSEREIKFRRYLFTFSIKREIRHLHVVVVLKRPKKCTKICAARANLLFCLLNLFFFYVLVEVTSLDLKVPSVSLQIRPESFHFFFTDFFHI